MKRPAPFPYVDEPRSKFPLLFLPILLFIIVSSLPTKAPADTLEIRRENRTLAALVRVATPSEQTKAEVCRETQNIMKQYQAEWEEANRTVMAKEHEAKFRDHLSELRRAIAGGFVVSGLNQMAGSLRLEVPEGTKARLELQKTVRNMIQMELQKAGNSTEAELQAKVDRIEQQITTRRQRLTDLNCEELLALKQSAPSKSGCDFTGGTWKTSFGEMTFTIKGNTATASYAFDSGTVRGALSDGGRVLSGTYSENEAKGTFQFVLAEDGQSFTGRWRRTSGRREPPSGTWEGKCIQQ
jgi:IS1 family transposase